MVQTLDVHVADEAPPAPPVWLTRQEIRALDEALSGFVQVVRVVVPASSERDETLREIEGFRDMLRMRLSSTRS